MSGYAAIKKLEQKLVAAVLVEYKREGMDTEAVAYQIKHRFPQVPIILLSAHFQMPEWILWLVDEYVLKSEPPDRLVGIIERVTRSTNKKQAHSSYATSQRRVPA